jgi:hypothetical protein
MRHHLDRHVVGAGAKLNHPHLTGIEALGPSVDGFVRLLAYDPAMGNVVVPVAIAVVVTISVAISVAISVLISIVVAVSIIILVVVTVAILVSVAVYCCCCSRSDTADRLMPHEAGHPHTPRVPETMVIARPSAAAPSPALQA